MTSPVLEKILQRPNPLLNFRWSCVSLPFDTGDLIEYVESLSLPMPSLETADPYFVAGTYKNYPGTYRIDTFTMNMYEDENFTTTSWYNDWQSKVRNPQTGLFGSPSTYKQEMQFEFKKEGSGSTLIRLKGCWPTQMNSAEFNYTESSRIVVSVTFSLDSIEIQ